MERVAITMPTGRTVMLTGDFNCVIAEEDRVSGNKGTGMDRSSKQLGQLVCDHGLVDAVKKAQGPGGHFTQVDPAGNTKSRIDFVFLPTGWKAEEAKCTPVCFSDHSLLTLRIDLGGQLERGRGVWKLNTSLLEDEQTRRSYREHYAGWWTLRELYQNQTEWWASVKERTRSFFQTVGKGWALFHQRRHKCLTCKLQDLHRQAVVEQDVREAMWELKA
ncbi:hypothetical protein Y1Q_0018885 [Alligator mississippiensis]|uniref:Endonuclease/exonuclease/phosphatase domain-containing protein n=1 Tax=Alligator mississippiensis TaxID=8496 RepID=A0A151M346_ALLMI|nr:hypothetical protein Y1Q_0018885 [Alligator mississippiensis]